MSATTVMNATIVSKRTSRQRGMSLIELMIAMTVLVVGMLSLMTLVTTAISSNNRNKLDTTGTMLAQSVLDRIASIPSLSGTTFTMTDCNPGTANTWTIATAAPAAVGSSNGAQVDGNGNIDFAGQTYSALIAASPNYAMKYVVCGSGGTQATYEVRWNVRRLTAFTNLVTVSARQLGAASGRLPFFSPPVTLRTIVGS